MFCTNSLCSSVLINDLVPYTLPPMTSGGTALFVHIRQLQKTCRNMDEMNTEYGQKA